MRLTKLAFAAAALTVGVGLAAPAAFADPGHPGSAAGFSVDLGPAPGGLPANCPFQNGDAAITWTSGQLNPETITGDAVFSENGADLYAGHATFWANATNITLTFNGTGSGGGLFIHFVSNKPNGHLFITCS
jgi:hypothetical protein